MSIYANAAIILMIAAAVYAVVYMLLPKEPESNPLEVLFSYENLRQDVKRMMDEHASANIRGMGLSKQALRNQEEQRREEMRCLRNCCSGDIGAKEAVKEKIRTYLLRKGVNEETILYAVAFDTPQRMSGRELAESIIYAYDGGNDTGFIALYELCRAAMAKRDEKGRQYYEITEEDIRSAWAHAGIQLDFKARLEILTQLLYADEFALGVIDVLNQQKGLIEEIQVGFSGMPEKVYNYKEELRENGTKEKKLYSKDSVHILVHGRTIRLSYLGFLNDGELQRVLRNLIKNTTAGELTVNHPEVVVDTMDGRRISVARPPISDSWIGLIRKFDSVRTTELGELYQEYAGSGKLVETIRQIVRSGSNIAFTGEMEAGKTTLFRAALKEVKKELNIRVVEAGSFELNLRFYMNDRNTMALRVTERTPEQEVLAFLRKTTGHVFAVGEVNSLEMANLTINLSKIAQQVMFSAHYITTEEMVADFKNAKLCVGRYSNERLAETDAVRSLGFDVHIRSIEGKRYIQYINEVVPTAGGKETDRAKTYTIRKIAEYDEAAGSYVFYHAPSKRCFDKAAWYMEPGQHAAFLDFFGEHYTGETGGAA